MSTLWTPGGEHPVGRRDDSGAGAAPPASGAASPASPPSGPSPEELGGLDEQDRERVAAHLEELRNQLLSAPAHVVVANHAYGLFELAAIHLSQNPPRLEDARLAIDAMASLVEGLAGRLGEPERSLRDALAQVRLAYVQIGGTAPASNGEESPAAPG